MRTLASLLTATCLMAALFAQAPRAENKQPKGPYSPTAEERADWISRHDALARVLASARPANPDAEVYLKASEWMKRYPEEIHTAAYYANVRKVLDRGMERVNAPAPTKGNVIHAYRSAVDGSVQPYAVHLPDSYDGATPHRLDLVLHGRGATLTEVSFIAQHEFGKPVPPRAGVIEAHVFGRTNNAYRWAGETDVHEALAAVTGRYKIDPDRIVLRGFSMGGAGAWHLGLHFPSKWTAFEAGAGFNETLKYAKKSDLPDYQLKPLRIYDSYLYARNGWNVPFVGYGGELDPQLQASRNVAEQLKSESLDGLRALFLVGPRTEHKWEPGAKKKSDAFLDQAIAAPARYPAQPVKFVTHTPRYGAVAGFSIEALEKLYERAELEVEGPAIRIANIARLSIPSGEFTLDGAKVSGPRILEKRNGKWTSPSKDLRKVAGLQGPVDDAFMSSFIVVRPTGKASKAALDRMAAFQADFAKWMRGDVPIVDDAKLTSAQISASNLIVFGDPSSNTVLRKIAKKLPLKWTDDTIEMKGAKYDAASHLPVLVYPNPLNPRRYIVVNSGHTFGEREFRGTNALLYPRLGDWAILDGAGEAKAAGLFDEFWK